ncbi:MAG: DUF434 domain-containing protein [Methanotrichaceae archaeon]|nr:DUF434 domain-containing protein [Methanotrichaceae archaeon]
MTSQPVDIGSKIKAAAKDIRYLADRSYPKDYALRFVADHYRLDKDERHLLLRVVVGRKAAAARLGRLLSARAIEGWTLYIDGYNVLITTESLLLGAQVFLCDDGLLRDIRGASRHYHRSAVTGPAIDAIFDILNDIGPSDIQILLDSQISKSGELAAEMRGHLDRLGLKGTARTCRAVDRELKLCGMIVATADGHIIDAIEAAIDLPAEVARRRGIVPLRI